MQARILAASLSAIAILALSTSAVAQQRVSSGNVEQRTSVQGPYQVQAQPQGANTGYLKIEGVEGEASSQQNAPAPPPPPRSGAGSTPSEQLSLNYEEFEASNANDADVAAPQEEQTSLLLPAVQRPPRAQQAAPRDPEQPVCGHCGSDVQAQGGASERPARRRGGFSLSIGGVTLGSGGVSVAVGDIDGDSGRGSRSEPSRGSTRPAPARSRGD